HLDLVVSGLGEGIRHPLGLGVSAGSIARLKNEPGQTVSSESDIGNIAGGLGFVAGITLLLFIAVSLFVALRMELIEPSVRHLAVLGLAIVAFGQWASGALYCTSVLLWFLLGGLAPVWPGLARRGSLLSAPTPCVVWALSG